MLGERGDGPRHWADEGDVIVLPYGDQHRMGGVRNAPAAPISPFMVSPPWPRLSEWRMHVAEGLLATTDLGVPGVARRVGYDAEEAFSRAFKRAHGTSPSAWRAVHTAR